MADIFYIAPREYVVYFNYTVFFLIIWAIILCFKGTILDNKVIAVNQVFGMMVAAILILFMGLRPISGAFGDTMNYAAEFKALQKNANHLFWIRSKEWLWDILMTFFAKFGNLNQLFLLCATVYVGALWLAMRRIFVEYNYIPFLVIICMFTFWTYGVNGVRNGMGASLFILAMTYPNNIPAMAIFAILGAGIHNSIYLMLAGAILAWFVNHSRTYIIVWFACILISLVAGDQIQEFLSSYATSLAGENKFTAYLNYSEQQMISDGFVASRSFRWDFIAYSALGVATGAYFIMRREFKDEYYHWIFNTFLICNAFWILIIRAPYSNRFAQISWFIMPVVMIYPFMKERFWINHEKMLGVAILIAYAFGFFSNMLPLLLNLI